MTQDSAVCTIIAKNYIAFARTLARSFLVLHPGYKCYVLIVDDFEGYINPQEECFEIVRLSDLRIPNLQAFRFKYDVKELCTATKAWLLEYLIQKESIDSVLYLDPDILVTGSLDQLYRELDTYDIVLTPHLDTDYPDDGLLPDDGYILRSGQFNLGFIGINSSANAKSFLEWWKTKLYGKCVVDTANGYFVDQKFIDFVPLFFKNHLVETNAGYNVAYWNLHSRRLHKASGDWKCNDGPLYFFHFSGYVPGGGGISSHIPISVARHRLNRSDLKPLFEDYQTRLLENGYKETRSWPYTFATFKSGEPIPYDTRSFYREQSESGRGFGDPFESDHLKRQAVTVTANGRSSITRLHAPTLTHSEQLDAILNSRSWFWVARYGRFKDRYVAPLTNLIARVFGRPPGRHI
jgi:lipopolysaccharide biosynthesis glycosyltransferase